MNFKLKIIASFIIIYGALCFLSLNRHFNAKSFTYHSELWADKAGYNVYLPIVFIYNNNTKVFPDSLVKKTGSGFEIDSVSRKIITKYPYGVALLQAPFWLIAHAVSPDKTGYSFFYQKSVDTAGCFYLTLGLFLLFFTIKDYRSFYNSILLILLITFSTGIFYYGIFETGMSHIYSFFCMAGILFLFLKKNKLTFFTKCLWLGILCTLFIIIRPVNAIFLIPILCFLLNTIKTLNFRGLGTLPIHKIGLIALICILIVLPQLYYYKYAFGNFFSNSYYKEPFFFPSLKRINSLLFSPDNGMLLYYPVILVLLIIYSFKKTIYNTLILLLLISYVLLYASWWSLNLGCGFGHRAVNDIILVFFIPLCFYNLRISKPVFVIFIVLTLINIKFMFSFDGCLYSSLGYNYSEYFSILFGEFK